jgi:hypothetical protein
MRISPVSIAPIAKISVKPPTNTAQGRAVDDHLEEMLRVTEEQKQCREQSQPSAHRCMSE